MSQERHAPNAGKSGHGANRLVLQSMFSGHGNDDQEDHVPGLGIYQRLSIFASNGYDGDGQSPNLSEGGDENADNDSNDDQKTHSGDSQQTETDKSVDLLDEGLDGASPIEITEPPQSAASAPVVQVEGLILRAIRRAEHNGRKQVKQGSPENFRQPEEYESLVWGQSIWSSNIPKESAKIFMANLQQMQSSDINTGPVQSEPPQSGRKPTPPNEAVPQPKKDFDELQKDIEQKIQESFPEDEQPEVEERPPREKVKRKESHPDVAYYMPEQASRPTLPAPPQGEFYLQNDPMLEVQQLQSLMPAQPTEPEGLPQTFQRQTSFVGEQREPAQPPDYGNQFLDHSSAHGRAANFSVHSSAHAQIFEAEAGPGFTIAGDESSNYTHHPFSTYGNPHVQEPANGRPQQYGGAPMHGPHKYELNRPHIFINRKINRFMMGPIYRSKQTVNSLLMHRYSGVPWRGGSNNPSMTTQGFGAYQMGNAQPDEGHPSIAAQDQQHFMPQEMPSQQNVSQSQAQPIPGHENSMIQSQSQSQRTQPADQQTRHMPQFPHAQQQPMWDQQKADQTLSHAAINAPPFYPTRQSAESDPKMQGRPGNMHFNPGKQMQRRQFQIPIPIPILPVGKGKGGAGQKNQQRAVDPATGKPRTDARPWEQPVEGFQGEMGNTQAYMAKQQTDNLLFDSFQGEEILQSKKELDLRMKLTTEHLFEKITKAKELEFDDDDNEADEAENEKQPTFDGLSIIDQSEVASDRESALNKSMTLKELKSQITERQQPVVGNVNDQIMAQASEVRENPRTKMTQYEDRIKRKEARENIFKKLQEQINQFREEIPATNEPTPTHGTSSISPKRQNIFNKESQDQPTGETQKKKLLPFRQDAKQLIGTKQYIDKVLNLMNMIKEIDDVTNVAELKNKLEKKQLQMNKTRLERNEALKHNAKMDAENAILTEQIKEAQLKLSGVVTENGNLLASLNNLQINQDELKKYNEQLGFESRQQVELLNQEKQDLYLQINQLKDLNTQLQSEVVQLTNQRNQFEQNTFQKFKELQSLQSQVELFNQRQKNYQIELKTAQDKNIAMQQALAEQKQLTKQVKAQLTDATKSKAAKSDKEAENSSSSDSNDDSELTAEEKIKNQAQQIKKLQDYIKKMRLDMLKTQTELEAVQDHSEHEPSRRQGCGTCAIKDNEVHDLRAKLENQQRANREQIRQQLYEMQGQGSGRSSRRSFHTHEAATQTQQAVAEECKSSERPKAEDRRIDTADFNNRMLLNNYLRNIKQFVQNQDADAATDFRKENLKRVEEISYSQQIMLFDEEDEDSDSSRVTAVMMQELVELSLRVTQELLAMKTGTKVREPKIGLTLPQIKEMAAESKADRKSCHAIIVEIEKQMYEMGNTFSKRSDSAKIEDVMKQFNQIQTTYLKLPLRLKPIFDYSKKLETVLSKALKQQSSK